MNGFGWIIAIILIGAAAGGIFFAFRSPSFVAGLTAIVVEAAWSKLKPGLGRLFRYTPPKDEAERKERARKKALKEMSRK